MKTHNKIVTCLLGDPVEHSVSDTMFQYFASATGINNYQHLKLRIPTANSDNLGIAIRAMTLFDFAGANITLPYKEKVIPLLDKLSVEAERVGAVNTIVNRSGRLAGFNTDGCAALKAIEKHLRPLREDDCALILGAGGCARAIIGSVAPKVGRVVVLSRASDSKRATRMRDDFAKHNMPISVKALNHRNLVVEIRSSSLVVNATPVGMYPHSERCLVSQSDLEAAGGRSTIKDKMFFDAIFNPSSTKLLWLAESYGAAICSGIYMMIYQGIEAFKLWTGKDVPAEQEVEQVRTILINKIKSAY